MLNGIDVSNWQAGIDIAATSADFVIVKATGGAGYVSPSFRKQADATLAAGKLLGVYHFAGDGGLRPAKDEAAHFVRNFAPYKGRAVPVLDMEGDALHGGASWASEWLHIVKQATGATPMFYTSASAVYSQDWSAIKDYPLWKASYISKYAGKGFQRDPVDTWGSGAFGKTTVYQYTSQGRIKGYGGDLDLDCFYGTRSDWTRYAKGGHVGRIENMVNEAVRIANDDSHGYSWKPRWGDPDYDCSSLVYHSANHAGYSVGEGDGKTRYTGTMIADFTAAGFTKLAYNAKKLKRGDILLRDPWGRNGHTEMYIGDGKTVGAHSSETGGIYGQPGDQTGNEISVGPNYGNWDYILRPPEGGIDMNDAEMKQLAAYIAQAIGEQAYGSDAKNVWSDDGSAKTGDRYRNNYQTLRMMLIAQKEQNEKLDKLIELLSK